MKRVEFEVAGDKVRGALHQPAGRIRKPLPLVMLLHGINSCRVEWYEFPQRLAEAGYSVFALDFRGHGESEGERGYIGVERAHADTEAAIERLAQEYGVDATRVALVGHSLGASLAIHFAQEIPEVKAIVALAPPSRLAKELNPVERAGYFLADKLDLPIRLLARKSMMIPYRMEYERLYASRSAVLRAKKDDFLIGRLPVRNYQTLMHRFDPLRAAKEMTKPALVLIAEYDVVVGPWNSRSVFEAIAAEDKTLITLSKSGHSMAGDHQSEVLLAHVRRWLDEHLGGDE
jgi:pimeloyl-ACP methyl ester carboxylesterase